MKSHYFVVAVVIFVVFKTTLECLRLIKVALLMCLCMSHALKTVLGYRTCV
jgi:hypothetical protein